MTVETFTFIVAIILLCLPFIDWTASYILHRAVKNASHSNIALKERARIAIMLAVVTTVNSFFGLLRLTGVKLDPPLITIALSVSFILVGVPNMYWLYLYYKNRLRK